MTEGLPTGIPGFQYCRLHMYIQPNLSGILAAISYDVTENCRCQQFHCQVPTNHKARSRLLYHFKSAHTISIPSFASCVWRKQQQQQYSSLNNNNNSAHLNNNYSAHLSSHLKSSSSRLRRLRSTSKQISIVTSVCSEDFLVGSISISWPYRRCQLHLLARK